MSRIAAPEQTSPGGPLSKSRLRVWLRLLKVTRLIESRIRENLRKDHDSTLPRFDVMAALDAHPEGLKMSEISSFLRVSNGNVTGIVDRLVEDGIAVRVPVVGDRRATTVRLTRKGEEEFRRQAAAHERWVDELLQSLDDRQTELILAGLTGLGEQLEEGEERP